MAERSEPYGPLQIPLPSPPSKNRAENHVVDDIENSVPGTEKAQREENISAFKSLGWLDRFLAVWILLAMIVGIILGNFVPSTGPALEKGKFVGVSVPIGKTYSLRATRMMLMTCFSCWTAGNDVSHIMQGPI